MKPLRGMLRVLLISHRQSLRSCHSVTWYSHTRSGQAQHFSPVILVWHSSPRALSHSLSLPFTLPPLLPLARSTCPLLALTVPRIITLEHLSPRLSHSQPHPKGEKKRKMKQLNQMVDRSAILINTCFCDTPPFPQGWWGPLHLGVAWVCSHFTHLDSTAWGLSHHFDRSGAIIIILILLTFWSFT